jgi:hypothetical protein
MNRHNEKKLKAPAFEKAKNGEMEAFVVHGPG